MRSAIFLAIILAGSAVAPAAFASEAKRNWTEEKCFRFTRDWPEALRRFGVDGVSPRFRRDVDAFIAAHCVKQRKICPRTPRERQLIDILAIRVVNEGMSTTFLPFDCPN